MTVKRPWHWGIVIVSDPDLGGQIPEVDPESRVSANESGLIVLVRHAQDVEDFNGDLEWAEAEVTVIHRSEAPPTLDGRTQVFEGRLETPSGRLQIGDADDEVVMNGLTTASFVRVGSPSHDMDSPSRVWIDVWAA
ncbi:hypothetical protein ACFVAJ_21465 [Agromyces sp. NPDC057679]|uniref:hypothetical protein n=1 Tax=Agromyces sp. NPDC057679 TaxID=3346207 RepID=UPI00366D9185